MSALVEKILDKITSHAMKEVLGDGKIEPKNALQLAELTDRVQRYKDRCGLLNFIKPNGSKLYYPKQDAFVRSVGKCAVSAAVGANQIGKTSALAAIGLSWALGEFIWTGEQVVNRLSGKPIKPPIRIFYGAKSFTMAHAEVTMKKMNELLPFEALGIMVDRQQGRSAHRIRFPEDLGGSEIKLLSYEQDPEDYEGTTWHLALWDEPPPRHAYISTARGCMKHHAPQAFAFTPIKEPWLFDEIYASPRSIHCAAVDDLAKLKKKSFCIVNFEIDDSPYLTQEAKEAFIATLDPEEIESRVHGKWKHLLGRIYKDFSRERHVLVTEDFFSNHPDFKTYTPFMVVDPADRRPFACAWGVITPRNEIVFVDEWPNQPFHKMKAYDNNIAEYVRIFSEKENKLGVGIVDFRFMDPNFGQAPKAGTGRTLVEEFSDKGYYFDTNIDNEHESGHMVVREALREGRLFILDCCHNMIKAMESYTWDEFRQTYGSARNPKEKPKELFKDFADLVRYTCKSDLHYFRRGDNDQKNPWINQGK